MLCFKLHTLCCIRENMMGMTYFKNIMWNVISRTRWRMTYLKMLSWYMFTHNWKTQKRMSATIVNNQTSTQTDSFYDMSRECYCCTDMFTSTWRFRQYVAPKRWNLSTKLHMSHHRRP